MFKKLQKPVSWLLVQSLVAISLPLSAMAAPEEVSTRGFELPINDVLMVDQVNASPANFAVSAKPQPLPLESASPSVAVNATESNAGDTGAVLEIDDIIPQDALSKQAVTEEEIVITVDNDADETTFNEAAWQEMQDDPSMTMIKAGTCFPVSVSSALSSKNNKVGDALEARLKVDIKIGGKLIARKGDKVVGHVASCSKARRILHAELSKNRWMRANGCIGLQFDEIVTADNEHLPLVAKPARRARIVKNMNEGRLLGVNDNGEVAAPLSMQLKSQAVHLAIRGAASAGGALSFGIVPAAYGIVGAINPSFAFLHPVGKNVPHRRLKGFAMGVVSGLPGGFLIADTILKGVEAEIKPGDEFLAEFHQDFTGEAGSSASLIPGSSQKVRGEVILPNKK